MSLVISVLPILLAMLVGYLTARLGALPRDRWEGINTLNFQILIPAMLIHAVARADLASVASGPWILAMLATLALIGAAVFAVRALLGRDRLPDPVFTTLFQSVTRWNAFVALAAAEQFIGPDGVAQLAIGMAVMIPTINVANIVVLAAHGGGRAGPARILVAVARNPLVVACVIGLAINLSGLGLPEPIARTLELIARAALGMGLMAVGAGIALRRLMDSSPPMWLGVGLRLLLCPLVFLAFAAALGFDLDETLTGALMFSVPAAANGYVIAQRMGGDADLYADILTWQTILSLGLLPVWAALVHAFF